jgi:LPPG:FO 2-phospho-L-lactate transferase
MRVVVLAGGTGGAKLACGLMRVLGADLSVIVNTGDDDTFYGLPVSPDVDSLLYRLSGRFSDSRGFGVEGDTFNALGMLRELGSDSWFQLGDADIGLQLARLERLRGGATLSDAVAQLAERLGIICAVVPMSDDPVRSRVVTAAGERSLQEWFVRDHCEPRVSAVRIDGGGAATPSARALRALGAADAVVIGPSNPYISIDPILAVLGDALNARAATTVAVSPLVGDRALKGPTAAMMRDLGHEVSVTTIARHYRGLAGHLIVDTGDAARMAAVDWMTVHGRDILMQDQPAAERLARDVLQVLGA